MKIHTLFTPQSVDELYFAGKTTVVIDVLRSSTTILTALQNGAREVIPVNSLEFAMKVSGNAFGGQTLLGGERNTKKIEGFNLGNSPLEYTENAIRGKSVILFSSNGTGAIIKAKYSEKLFVCSFNNIEAIANYLTKINNDVEILCSGSNGMFSLEDSVCAGNLIDLLEKKELNLTYSDASISSKILFDNYKNDLLNMMKNSEHGKKLIKYGFEKDIELAAEVGIYDNIPYYLTGVIKLLNRNS